MMSETTYDRWKDNQPLTNKELYTMRFSAAWRFALAVIVLAVLALTLCGCRSLKASTKQFQFPEYSGQKETELTKSEKENDSFEGVVVVVAVEKLTEFAPNLRRRAALEADRVLRELANKKLKGRIRTRLIAEVAEPNVFQNFEVASMESAKPVLIHVLVPAKNTGLVQDTIRRKVEELVEAHFLEVLKKYRLLVTFERLDPDAYEVALDMASYQEPPKTETEAPPPGPEKTIDPPPLPTSNDRPTDGRGMLTTMITAWLTERSKLIAKVVHYYQSWKGLA